MIYGIVLAAGRGRRVGIPKALLRLGTQTFLQRAVEIFAAASLDVVVVVNSEVEGMLPPAQPHERRVTNPDPDQSGMFGSARLGVSVVRRLEATGGILLPVDFPLVTSNDLRILAARLDDGASIVVATHGGRRGHPVGLGLAVLAEIEVDPTLTSLRDVVRRDPGRVVETEISEGAILGVNTQEDLARVSNRTFR